MFVASWNAKGVDLNDTTTYIPLELTENGEKGYYINESCGVTVSREDDLYTLNGSGILFWLSSPNGYIVGM